MKKQSRDRRVRERRMNRVERLILPLLLEDIESNPLKLINIGEVKEWLDSLIV